MFVFVRCCGSPFFFSLFVMIVAQVQARNETLEKLQFPKQASVSPVFKFSAGNVDEVKKAISNLRLLSFLFLSLYFPPLLGSGFVLFLCL